MEVVIVPTPEATGRLVADVVEGYVRAGGTLGLATGSSPEPAYDELVRRHRETGLDFSGCRAFLLDEYVGLPGDHPQAYRQVIRRVLADRVGLVDVRGPDGTAADLAAEATSSWSASAATGTSGSTSRGRRWAPGPVSRPSPSAPAGTTRGSSARSRRCPITC